MKYYKYIDIDYLNVLDQLQLFIKNRMDLFDSFWVYLDLVELVKSVPNFLKIFEPLNLTPRYVGVISLFNNNHGIHIDISNTSVRINIPIFNCEYSETRFFIDNNPEYKQRYLKYNVPYYILDESKCTHVDTLILNRPAALRVKVPHQVIPKKFPRISLSVSFDQNIEYLLEE